VKGKLALNKIERISCILGSKQGFTRDPNSWLSEKITRLYETLQIFDYFINYPYNYYPDPPYKGRGWYAMLGQYIQKPGRIMYHDFLYPEYKDNQIFISCSQENKSECQSINIP
jgi:hypothetical protein